MNSATTTVWTLSNGLSLLRAPLAFLFLSESPVIRCIAILLAMVSDVLDGYLARSCQQTSPFGATLDPLMDKFFAVFAFVILLSEGRLSGGQMAALISRDFALILFGCWLCLSGRWTGFQFRALWCGKITTSLQFLVLLTLSLEYVVPSSVYAIFIALGVGALFELGAFGLINKKRLD